MHVAPVQFPRPEITVAFDWDPARLRPIAGRMTPESALRLF